MRPAWAAVLVALGLVLAPAAAGAAESDDAFVVTYPAVTLLTATTDPDGVTTERTDTAPADVVMTCTAVGCTLTGGAYPPFLEASPAFEPGEDSAYPFAGSISVCEPGYADGSMVVRATATGFSATLDAPSPGWEECPDGRKYRHAMVMTWTGGAPSGDVCVFEETRCVEPTPTPTPTPTVVPALVAAAPADPAPAGGSASLLATGGAAAPSVLSTLPTPAEAGTAPQQLLLAAVLTVVLVLLVAFPTSLLNSAVESGSDRLSGWWAGRAAPTSAPSDTGQAATATAGRLTWMRAWWWAAGGVAGAAVISAFIDPEFGFNPGSARVLLSILVSFAVDVVLGWTVVILLVRRLVPAVTHSYAFQPLSLLVVVAAVVFTRVTGFEPGIVFGLVAGVAFGTILGRAAQARAALAALGYAFVLALLAWILYGAVGGGAVAGESFGMTLLVETLSSIAIGGMAALPIALFPLRGLPGHAVFAWKRSVWAGCYAVGLLAFFIVLMPMPFAWDGVGWDLWAWIAVYLGYALFAVVAWLAIARPWHRDDRTGDAVPASASATDAVPVAEER